MVISLYDTTQLPNQKDHFEMEDPVHIPVSEK